MKTNQCDQVEDYIYSSITNMYDWLSRKIIVNSI